MVKPLFPDMDRFRKLKIEPAPELAPQTMLVSMDLYQDIRDECTDGRPRCEQITQPAQMDAPTADLRSTPRVATDARYAQ